MKGIPRTTRFQLIKMQIAVALLVLITCSSAFIVNDILLFRRTLTTNILATARILGQNLIPTLTFLDANEATKILSSLDKDEGIINVSVFDAKGNLFAYHGLKTPIQNIKISNDVESDSVFTGDALEFYYKIRQENEILGTLYIKSDLHFINKEYRSYGIIVAIVLIAGLLLSILLSNFMQRLFSRPIIHLVETVKNITQFSDYSLRVGNSLSNNASAELLELSQEFDRMIEQIQSRDKAVVQANEGLEKKVAARTKELEDAQKIAVHNAHAAGMTEIATGVLHNIGNIINSVNISLGELEQISSQSKVVGLTKACDLLTKNRDKIAVFLTDDPSGKMLPEYLKKLSEALTQENKIIQQEVIHLARKINLIKDIVDTQQSYARGDMMREEVDLSSVIEETLSMQNAALSRHQIRVERKIDPSVKVLAQKVKIAHIILNLVKNAKEAMDFRPANERVLTIELGKAKDSNQAFIKISDTGEGVSAENMAKIFSHGFTTKKYGHGFGLHYCVNAMREMGGDLKIYSDGVNKGVTFTMTFS